MSFVQCQESISLETSLTILSNVFEAVETLHSVVKYCHFDISLENVLVNCSNFSVKLIDFGCCKALETNGKKKKSNQTSLKTMLRKCCNWKQIGKEGYRAPEFENLKGQNRNDAINNLNGILCDYWSVGYLMFCFVFGIFPFESSNLNHCQEYFSFVYDYNCNVKDWINVLKCKQIIKNDTNNNNDELIEMISKLLVHEPQKRVKKLEIVCKEIEKMANIKKLENKSKSNKKNYKNNRKEESKDLDWNKSIVCELSEESSDIEMVTKAPFSSTESISYDIESNFHPLL